MKTINYAQFAKFKPSWLDDWSGAAHYAKAGAGRRALERIINGEDHNTVIEEMEAEWSSHCREHIFD